MIKNTKTIQAPRFKLTFVRPSSSALSKIIKAGYAVLQLEYFFTAGPDEVRAWTIRVRASSAHVCWKHTYKHTHTHSIPRSTLLAPSLISHFQLCHGCALASHYRPRITSITAELLNGESGGLHWLRRATIDFAHYVHENVSILCRSACPPPAAGDKEPAHCACLICVTEVVCAKIDVAFHSTVYGPLLGGSSSVCVSVYQAQPAESLLAMGSQDLHQCRSRLYMLVLYFFFSFPFWVERNADTESG